MKIKNLPSVIKKRANVYIKKEFPIKGHKPKYLMQAFDWSDTIEGIEYWILVDEGKFLDAENHLREKNGDDLKEELFEIEKERKKKRMIELIEDEHWNTEASNDKEFKGSAFFLDEALDVKVNEPEVVPYKDEYVKIDPIVNSVIDKFLHRSRVGIEKYGTTLAENNTDDFYNHLQEELMDAILYLQKIKELKNK